MEDDTVRLEFMTYSKITGRVFTDWTGQKHFDSVPNDTLVYFPRAYGIFKDNRADEYDGVRVRIVSNKTNRVVDIIQ